MLLNPLLHKQVVNKKIFFTFSNLLLGVQLIGSIFGYLLK